MNVTLTRTGGQEAVSNRILHPLFTLFTASLIGLALLTSTAGAETVTNLEAVDINGFSTWTGPFPIILTGVILNDPGEMLDSTPDFLPWDDGANAYDLGAQWQIFVQTVTPGDRGGVELWIAQDYGNLPWEPHDGSDSYTDDQWTNQVALVSHDPSTGYTFQKGDLVTVTANGSLFYGGMQNINQEHSTDPTYDFSISLVSNNFGLPLPQVISLSSVISTNLSATGHYDIFDPTRQSGGEYYQGMRVRINGLTLVTADGWTTNSDWDSRFCTATDGTGRQFPLIHPLYDIGPAPTNTFDATGVFLQESGSATDGTFGYELFVQEVSPSDLPILNITHQNSSATVTISWPGSLSNFQLLCTSSLSSPNWTPVTNSPMVVNSQNTVSLPSAAAQQFYQLQLVQ
jgi:hypothetical protein